MLPVTSGCLKGEISGLPLISPFRLEYYKVLLFRLVPVDVQISTGNYRKGNGTAIAV